MTQPRPLSLLRDCRAAAAAEMAFVAPMLLILMFGAAELGNYFLDQHKLEKAVRDGARYAARQSFTNYPTCSTVSTTLRDNTRNVVMYGYLGNTTPLITPNIVTSDITISTSCATTVNSQTMQGLYFAHSGGAQIVTVTAQATYLPILGLFGFSGTGFHLNASSQAAVTGL
jgi:Flp pilus assembly protein TadG